jgi:hypothetical protein
MTELHLLSDKEQGFFDSYISGSFSDLMIILVVMFIVAYIIKDTRLGAGCQQDAAGRVSPVWMGLQDGFGLGIRT